MNESKNLNTEEMSEKVTNESERDESVDNEAVGETEPKDAEKLTETMFDIPSMVSTIISRKETIEIVVNIINEIIDLLVKRGIELTDEEKAQIQNVVNFETNKTDAIYAQLAKMTNTSSDIPVDDDSVKETENK